jgi:N6-L-threonylcarbamoyladenine synthase
MRSNLFTGIDTAKGLAVAWGIPIVGVHHMQAHALTPRLATALKTPLTRGQGEVLGPAFPYLSLLVSGGHTILVHTKTLTQHEILASTTDIAIGDALDKIARAVLPDNFIKNGGTKPYGRLLEEFAFGYNPGSYDYEAPTTRAEDIAIRPSAFGWGLTPPLSAVKCGRKSKVMEYSFSGTDSACQRVMKSRNPAAVSDDERRELAKEAMRVMFEHLASRVLLALDVMAAATTAETVPVTTLVVSGGVASNSFLRVLLRKFLDARGYPHVKLSFPPVELCTDNAAMIGWIGIEMFEAGWETSLGFQALRKWSLDADGVEGGVLGPDCWVQRNEAE